MLQIMLLNMALLATPLSAAESPMCFLGRDALADLPTIDKFSTGQNFYAGKSYLFPAYPDLIQVCPSLKANVLRILPIASDAVLQETKDAASRADLTIYFISAPEITRDGHHAIVQMGHYCAGLCGTWYTVSYILTPHGWKRDGEIPVPSVS